jgi:hypothetical protein
MRGKVLLVACALVGAPVTALAEDLGDAEGFRAESVTYREGQEPAGSVTVYMGPEGRRLEGIPPRGITMVVPADSDQRWLVDPRRDMYAVDPSRGKGGNLGGVLSHKPCEGFAERERVGEVTMNGRKTVKWECRHPAFGQVTQWFDPAINTVVRDRTGRGEVQELRKIRVGAQDPELFRFDPGEQDREVPVIRLFQQPGTP